MSKIFCEICGTAYNETATQCPICGSPRPASAEFSVDTPERSDAETRSTPVKGGRFSKSNVNKRLNSTAKPKAAAAAAPARKRRKKKKPSTAERVLTIAIVCLLIAIIGVMAYIILNFFVPRSAPESTRPQTTESTPAATTEGTVPPTTEALTVPCTGLKLTEETILFNELGTTWLLNVVATPANTTDTMTFASSDTSVATVSEDGKVTAVGPGTCTITVTCGEATVECQVVCEVHEETEPTETTQPVDLSDFKLNRSDFTLVVGESWLLYNGSIDAADITWTSSNPNVATVVNGTVKGIAKGMCWITAEYMGVQLKCVVYVQ